MPQQLKSGQPKPISVAAIKPENPNKETMSPRPLKSMHHHTPTPTPTKEESGEKK